MNSSVFRADYELLERLGEQFRRDRNQLRQIRDTLSAARYSVDPAALDGLESAIRKTDRLLEKFNRLDSGMQRVGDSMSVLLRENSGILSNMEYESFDVAARLEEQMRI